jgi:hypothetical protein
MPKQTFLNLPEEKRKIISSYILNEGFKQKDIMKWVRSTKTQETMDKLLYVMEYGLRKTESEFVASTWLNL